MDDKLTKESGEYIPARIVERPSSKGATVPEPLQSVLAEIHTITDLGHSQWYEVVYHDGESWCCFAGSKTFYDGEQVLRWVYPHEAFERGEE